MESPTGTAKRIAIPDVSNVPDSNGRIPKFLSVNNGVHSGFVRNSTIETSEKNFMASIESTKMIPIVTRTVRTAQENKIFSKTHSFVLRIFISIMKTRDIAAPNLLLFIVADFSLRKHQNY